MSKLYRGYCSRCDRQRDSGRRMLGMAYSGRCNVCGTELKERYGAVKRSSADVPNSILETTTNFYDIPTVTHTYHDRSDDSFTGSGGSFGGGGASSSWDSGSSSSDSGSSSSSSD